MSLWKNPLLWVLAFLLGWIVLIVVQISLGMGGAPGGGGAP